MVLFSDNNTKAAQEGGPSREITISNKLLVAVRIYSDKAPKPIGMGKYLVNSIDKTVLPKDEEAKFLITGNVIYYSPLKFESGNYETIEESREYGGDSHWPECTVLTEKEKEIPVSMGVYEITLE